MRFLQKKHPKKNFSNTQETFSKTLSNIPEHPSNTPRNLNPLSNIPEPPSNTREPQTPVAQPRTY